MPEAARRPAAPGSGFPLWRRLAPDALLALLLALLTTAVFLPALGGQFVWDDNQYVSENRFIRGGLSLRTAVWAFTTFYASNWHPLTWLSHALDVSLFGLDPVGHHAVNLLLHVVNAVLLFSVLKALTGARWRSLAAAAFFAIHPLRVQSVAWVAERKDVLSALFWLATLAVYLAYARRPGRGRASALAVCFCLGLLAKPMVVTLPLVLIFLDYWPLGRFGGVRPGASPRAAPVRALLREKAPLFALAAASCVMTVLAQRSGGTVASLRQFPLWVRCANALQAYAGYLGKAVWPVDLSITYPHPGRDLPLWPALLAAVLLATITVSVFRARASRPFLLTGWCWYLGTLVPVIGLVQVAAQAMADRYTYLPLVGISIAAVWWAADLSRGRRAAAVACGAAAVVAVVGLGGGTRGAIVFWRDNETLFSRALSLRPNALAYTNLGVALAKRGDVAAAIANYRSALALEPDDPDSWYNLGRAYARQKAWTEAERALQLSLRIRPAGAVAWSELGIAQHNLQQDAKAEASFRTAIRLEPDLASAYSNLAFLYLGWGDRRAARRVVEELRRISPEAAADLERFLSSG